MSDLKDALMTVDGVGDKTADELLEVLADMDMGEPEPDPLVEKATEEAREGNYRRAAILLTRSDK